MRDKFDDRREIFEERDLKCLTRVACRVARESSILKSSLKFYFKEMNFRFPYFREQYYIISNIRHRDRQERGGELRK